MIKDLFIASAKAGGWIEYDNGERLEIAPDEAREVLEVWGNGAVFELFYYPDPLPGEDASDCMRVVIRAAGGKPRGWLLNIEDANSLIHALSTGIRLAIDDRRLVAPMVK